METFTFSYPAEKSVPKRAYVGVVGSGDIEILLEPSQAKNAEVFVRTRFDGYKEIWKNILDRFFEENKVAVKLEINDGGATPGVIKLRLLQALEVSTDEK